MYGVTDGGARFGGFNSAGFSGSDDYAASNDAFLFCWPASAKEPVLLSKVLKASKLQRVITLLTLFSPHKLLCTQQHQSADSIPCLNRQQCFVISRSQLEKRP